MHRFLGFLFFVFVALTGSMSGAAPVFLDDQFELPAGFRIYRAAEKELTGGSYALRFDGQGRLLVGDGTALRRLVDKDNDGVFDGYDVIATGLGWRGPQGILVYGDRLFAVGGDGIQMYEGYSSGGPLKHMGRVGAKLNTGGDHDSHTLLRGHDGYIYFMAGNGSGLTNRAHITEETSPCLVEREASVFRISPDGKKWECIATGGRNPPSLGMNYLGDLFSFDSDMEWHVGLPFYRPARLNHWVIGGDQGWHDVGALPPYAIDNVPGILDVGRASPNWGVFYEHNQFPAKYNNAFLVCDYRWKSESTDDYRTTGRLVSFFLERSGSRWKAKMETLARPKPGAKDAHGRSIPFALVDIDVAPDGSIYMTEHNQGVWRIVYDPKKKGAAAPEVAHSNAQSGPEIASAILNVPQLSSEWARLEQERLSALLSKDYKAGIIVSAITDSVPLDRRLRAIRYLAPTSEKLPISSMARSSHWEIRAQAAWLAGLQGKMEILRLLLKDSDPFVRRRAAEGFLRSKELRVSSDRQRLPGQPADEFRYDFIHAINDPDRTVRHLANLAFSRMSIYTGTMDATPEFTFEFRLRELIAHYLRGGYQYQNFPSVRHVGSELADLTEWLSPDLVKATPERLLNLLRAIQMFEPQLQGTNRIKVGQWVLANLPNKNANVSWEQARLLGQFKIPEAYPKLLGVLLKTSDPVRQFHFFQCIAKLPTGWTPESEKALVDWTLKTQQGWFAEFGSKGVEFPLFLQTALEEFASNHKDAVLAAADKIQLDSLLGSALLGVIAEREPQRLFAIYKESASEAHKIKALQTMARIPKPETAAFLRAELKALEAPALRKAAISSLKAMPKSPENEPFLNQPVISNKPERPDTEIHQAIMAASLEAGDAMRGRKIYERLQCNSCHAGGQTPGQEGRIFGPDLVGATARLTRAELADSIVYPSKQVPDRFKAVELTLKDGRELTGFITEKTTAHVTFADAQTIHRFTPAEIEKTAPQEKSLMPDGLLRTLTDQEIAHLLKFLNALGTNQK